ncbi:hypothetical protein [Neobacillus sp. LXY-1]|uniref:hypothetical protein n=1 Tax=Neobacillus sp. LXY-1 TaxID=3379133 RepID=UPI003EE2DB02
MCLKAALFEMKEALTNQSNKQVTDEFIQNLETKNDLSPGTLVYYFNHLFMFYQKGSKSTLEEGKKINRKWSKSEIDFMFQYILDRQAEGCLNITEILDEIGQLLNRGYQSVNYKYYSLVKAQEKQETKSGNQYHFTTIQRPEIPVVSTEVIRDIPEPSQEINNQTQPEDLLDILSGLITNVQQLPGIQLNNLLGSLYQLTNLALQNQQVVEQVEAIKSESQLEMVNLKNKLMDKEKQLLMEKKRNDDLQMEVAKLAKEITAFNKLGDAAKIQNLKSYNQRLNYIIDNFGIVLQVGS